MQSFLIALKPGKHFYKIMTNVTKLTFFLMKIICRKHVLHNNNNN